MQRHYILLDACVVAAFYAPKSTQNITLANRAKALFSGASPSLDIRFLIPNFCIPEVFAVFEKYRWGRTWNRHVKKSTVLTPSEFSAARKNFRSAIHNGSKILQVDLNRYHILCVDLISPVNNAYKIKRVRGGKDAKERAKRTSPASTYDMLVAAMGIWLSHSYGNTSFTVITGDERLSDVVYRAKSTYLSEGIRNHLQDIAKGLSLSYSADLYPEVIDLAHAAKKELRDRLPDWLPNW